MGFISGLLGPKSWGALGQGGGTCENGVWVHNALLAAPSVQEFRFKGQMHSCLAPEPLQGLKKNKKSPATAYRFNSHFQSYSKSSRLWNLNIAVCRYASAS